MGFQLTIAVGPDAGKELVFDQPSVVLGRTPECDIILYDAGVSRRHARIYLEGGIYLIEDMGSSNGTKVNTQKVTRQELFDGDTVGIGGASFTFAVRDTTDVSEAPADLNLGEEGKTRIVSSSQSPESELGEATLSLPDGREVVPLAMTAPPIPDGLPSDTEASEDDRDHQHTRIRAVPAGRKPASSPPRAPPLRALPAQGSGHAAPSGMLPARRSALASLPAPDTDPLLRAPPPDAGDGDRDQDTGAARARPLPSRVSGSSLARARPPVPPEELGEEGATSLSVPAPPSRRRAPSLDVDADGGVTPSPLARAEISGLGMEAATGSAPPAALAPRRSGSSAMSAAQKARFRREAKGIGGAVQVFWLDAGTFKRVATVAGLLMFGVAALGGGGWAVYRMQHTPVGPPEPSVLTREPLEQTFGLGEGVKFLRPDKKLFTFEFNSPIRAMAILHYQAKDISEGEVSVSVNGGTLGTVPPDTLNADARPLELVLPAQLLKKGEKNTVLFDNLHNPPNEDTWRVWNLWVEVQPLPELRPEQMLTRANEEYKRGLNDFNGRDIDKSNRYKAWKEFRNAWLMLQGHPDPKPELFTLAHDKMLAAQVELDRKCSALLLEVDKDINGSDRPAAAAALADVEDWFPSHDQPCLWRAARKRDENGL